VMDATRTRERHPGRRRRGQ